MNRPPPQKHCSGVAMTVEADGSERCGTCGLRVVFNTERRVAEVTHGHQHPTTVGFLTLPQGWGVEYAKTEAV